MLLRTFYEEPYHFVKADGSDIFWNTAATQEHTVSKTYILFLTVSRINSSVKIKQRINFAWKGYQGWISLEKVPMDEGLRKK